MNAYESGSQKVIPAVLLYAFYEDQILMIHARDKDGIPGKWNGLGGKLELGESITDAAVREFSEEAACTTRSDQWNWAGQLYFPNFKSDKKEDWWVTVFTTELSAKQFQQIQLNDLSAKEGPLHFISSEKISSLDLWEGDQFFLPFILRKEAFSGTIFYQNSAHLRHEIITIASVR